MTIVVAAVAACGGGGQESGLTPLSRTRMAALAMPNNVKQPPPGHPLLYVSDWSTGNVYAYDYPSGTQVASATITSFAGSEPYGQCVDRHGRVFITDYLNGKARSYLHGSPVIHHHFNPPGAIVPAKAIGCSVDRWDDLAVAYYSSAGPDNAYIAVWTGEVGAPTLYSLAACDYMWSPGYDHNGDLFVEGENAAMNAVSVCELPHLAVAMNLVTLSGVPAINSPGGVMWDGQYVALSDQNVNGSTNQTALYQTSLAGTTLTYQSTTTLTDTCYSTYTDVVQPFVVGTHNTPVTVVQGHHVIGANPWCLNAGVPELDYWDYPAGGSDSGRLTGPPANPRGQSVSFP